MEQLMASHIMENKRIPRKIKKALKYTFLYPREKQSSIWLRLWIIIGNKLIMKIEYTDGCICTSLTVDGKETAYMTPEEIKVSIRAMLDRETDIAALQDVWMSLIEHLGEYKDLGHCECCGDWISNYTLEI